MNKEEHTHQRLDHVARRVIPNASGELAIVDTRVPTRTGQIRLLRLVIRPQATTPKDAPASDAKSA